MTTVWITVLAIGMLSVAGCRGAPDPYLYAPCQPVSKNFRHPTNCNLYMACTSAGLWPMPCPWILEFDEITGNCQWPYMVTRCRENPPKTVCNPNPCVNGICSINRDSQLGYQCICQTGYTGPLCSIGNSPRTACNPNPCLNGICAVNSSSQLGYQCDCNTGYTGPQCSTDIDECSSLSRLCERGTCINLPGTFQCDCGNSGYTGVFCQIPPDEKPCINGQPCVNGRCQLGPNGNACVCSAEYEGPLCNSAVIGACMSRPCQNGGRCSVDTAGGYTCNCTGTGYIGPTCAAEADPCQSSPCASGGKCVRKGAEEYTCNCTGTGFGGDNCTTKFCSATTCSHGRCIEDTSGFSCDCRGSGYEGVFCDIPVTGNSTCLAKSPCVRGTCVHLASGDFCDCQGTGYTGDTCNIPAGDNYCYPGACTNGACVSGKSSFVCNCTGTIYTGPRCDMTACDFLEYNPCMNGATCIPQLRETYTCVCPPGFSGGNCETLEIGANCPTHQCPVDAPIYNYPDWSDLNCVSYYNCNRGALQHLLCPAGQKFDVITMVCKQSTEQQAIFCEYFRK